MKSKNIFIALLLRCLTHIVYMKDFLTEKKKQPTQIGRIIDKKRRWFVDGQFQDG